MVLYHVITTYHLLCAVTIQAANPQKSTIIMGPHISQKFANYKHLDKIFDEVIVCNVNYRFHHDPEKTAEYFRSVLPKLNQYDEIYVWGAQFSFGIFLAENKIPYIYCEEATGMLSRSYILEHIDSQNNLKKDFYEYTKSLGLYHGNGPGVKKIMCNFKAQLEGFQCDGMLDFDIVRALCELPEEKRNQIISFFTTAQKFTIPENATILFTQHFANLQLTSYEEQILIYQMVADYFEHDGHLAIKPHPDDLIPYAQIFRDATIIRERFPSEFLPFLVDHQPKRISTIYSTAIYNLRGYYDDVFELDMKYEKLFDRTHRYAMALRMAKEVSQEIYAYGCYDVLLEKLAETISCAVRTVESMQDLPNHGVILIDDIGSLEMVDRESVQIFLENAGDQVTVLFLNSLKDYCWYSVDKKSIWHNMKPLMLKKKKLEGMEDYEYFYASMAEEIIFAYTKNHEILERMSAMAMEEKLSHVGIVVKKESQTQQDEQIKMLEGILEATEQRLLYYMNRVEELEKK